MDVDHARCRDGRRRAGEHELVCRRDVENLTNGGRCRSVVLLVVGLQFQVALVDAANTVVTTM
jgi:hypothetical protein